MRLFTSFTILFFCSIQAFGQKVAPLKKTINKENFIKNKSKGTIQPLKSENLFGDYVITKYYSLTKHSAKKKDVNSFLNSPIKIEKQSISGVNINNLFFSIYEIEKMKKDDYLYRVFNQVISTEMIEIPTTFTVHKTGLQSFFGIIQLLNGDVAFPYKGGLIIAKRKLS